MTPELVFRVANSLALLGWIALLLAPLLKRWRGPLWLMTGRVLPLMLAIAYVPMLALHWPEGGGFNSVAEVRALFDSPGALVAGWLHYLAFDLFVGTWIAGRAAVIGMPHWQLVPMLLLTFLFGPAGLLVFVLWCAASRPSALRSLEGAAP